MVNYISLGATSRFLRCILSPIVNSASESTLEKVTFAKSVKTITERLIERTVKMQQAAKKQGRPFLPYKHTGRGRPKESILRAFIFYLKYSKARHVLKECKERDITITQYFDDLVSKDIDLKLRKVN